MFSKRIISMLVVLSFISQALVVVDTDSYSSVVVEDSSILEELSEQNGARTGEPSNNLSVPFTDMRPSGTGDCSCFGRTMVLGDKLIFGGKSTNASYDPPYSSSNEGRMTLYITDGTISGTTSLNKTIGSYNEHIEETQFNSPIEHIVMNDVLYFELDDGRDETGKELWRTDGTADGTYLVKDIREGSEGSNIEDMIVYDNHIYFSAYNGSGSSFGDLWKSDGTEEGTVPVTSTVNNLGPRYLTVFNDEIYFNGRDEDNGNKRFIWKSDGTEEGTVRVSDNTGPYDEIDGIFFSDFGGYLYFRGGYSSGTGWELWRTDGTSEGTVLFKDFNPGSGSTSFRGLGIADLPNNLFASLGDYFYFTAGESEHSGSWNIWRSDGTADGTEQISNLQNLVLYGGTFFSESQVVITVDDLHENDEYGTEPWIFDLTGAEEPRILRDFMSGTDDSYFNNVHVGANGIFYFTVNHNIGEFVTGTNLFRSDGTDNGTWMIDYLADTQSAGGKDLSLVWEKICFTGRIQIQSKKKECGDQHVV